MLAGNLLLQTCNFCLGIEFTDAAGQLCNLDFVLTLRLFGLNGRPQRIRRRFFRFCTMYQVEQWNLDTDSRAEVVCRKRTREEGIHIVQKCGVAVILRDERKLGKVVDLFIAFGLALL